MSMDAVRPLRQRMIEDMNARLYSIGPSSTGTETQEPDPEDFCRLLRARRERPCRCRAAEQRDELAPPHSITSVARRRIDVGNTIPNLFAVLRLTISSNFVGNSAGTSAGLEPRNTFATIAAPWRKMFGGCTP